MSDTDPETMPLWKDGHRWFGHFARTALGDEAARLERKLERGPNRELREDLHNVYRHQGEIEALYRARFRAELEDVRGADDLVWLAAQELDAVGLDRRVINPDDLPALRRRLAPV